MGHGRDLGPPARGYFDMTYDSKRKRVVMVQGAGNVWEWNEPGANAFGAIMSNAGEGRVGN